MLKRSFLNNNPVTSAPSYVIWGGKSAEEGIVGDRLTWKTPLLQMGGYSFLIRNKLREAVSDVLSIVIFYDEQDIPIDVDIIRSNEQIPGKLARRINSRVDSSVQEWTTTKGQKQPQTKVEIRVLDFRIVN